jgi:malonyl-CoA O-methyltransferase
MEKLKFDKNFDTYDENASVQKIVAKKLVAYFDKKKYENVLELGAGTGIFTKEILSKIDISNLTLNDYFDTRKYFEKIPYQKFLKGDMNRIEWENYDLVCSSSSFQWIDDLDGLLKNISQHSEELIFSIYVDGNLKEIKEHFKISLNYMRFAEILKILKKYFIVQEAEEEEITLNFNSPLNVLRHLKYTGVTGIGETTVRDIRSFSEKKLTYRVAYFKCRRKK